MSDLEILFGLNVVNWGSFLAVLPEALVITILTAVLCLIGYWVIEGFGGY